LRTTANPLVIPGLNPLQRLAFLEGILHWFNVIPQLVLVLMPLSFGLLGVPPLVLHDQVLLVRWFSHGARSALMPELYRWVFVVPVLLAVLGTVLGRPAPAPWLVLPLLVLLCLQLVNLAALRACWDRFPSDAVVWFRPVHARGVLEQGPRRWTVRLTAISERGVELSWSAADPGAGFSSAPSGSGDPRRNSSSSRGQLYQHPGAWPVRQAPPDRLAVLALLKRLVWSVGPEGWFARSALPICFPRKTATLALPVLE